MAMVRGSNPVWSFVDLTGHQFDDTFYMFVLENEIPYAPATVWHDANGNIPWTNPIQFLANGTLPIDIYWNPYAVYRLEFRQGNTQQDPLIYLVENYVPGQEGPGPIDTVALSTDNQVTNPQFAIINTPNPFSLTNVSTQSIEVGPGWFLDLTGTGNVTITRLAFNSATANPTNAPYGLEIELSGTWTEAVLRQRFLQNGMLWANKYVSFSITALRQVSPQSISAQLRDSLGNTLTEVLPTTTLDGNFTEYTGFGLLGDTVNTQDPPSAYIDLRINLPTVANLILTSIQLVAGDLPIRYPYEQDTIQRQIDHTFHYYRDSILFQPKQNILTGFNFALNPWQARSTADANLATFGYTADQVIAIQQAYVASATGNNIKTGQAGVSQNHGYKVTAVTSSNQFALVEFIDAATIRPYWGGVLSLLIKLNAQKQTPANTLRVKARLIYRASLPPTLAQNQPIASWASGSDPTYAAGWTAIIPKDDPVYNLSDGDNTLLFENMLLPSSSNANMTLGVVIYTLNDMIESGTPDNIVFFQGSLIPNEFAMESSVLTFDEMLSRCQYYYEKSYNNGVVPGTSSTSAGELIRPQIAFDTSGVDTNYAARAAAFTFEFNTVKRGTPTITIYNPSSGSADSVLAVLANGSSSSVASNNNSFSSNWAVSGLGTKYASYVRRSNSNLTTVASSSAGIEAYIRFHFVANARLGV